MPQDRSLDAFRRFYAEGGYVDAPKKRDRLSDLELALGYNSQYFADGGQVPGFGEGGLFGALRSYVKSYKDLFNKPISIAFPNKAYSDILKDQRFKSQFETGTSNGMYDPTERARFEHEMFGIPEDIDPARRPIYGHITDRSYPGMAGGYGEWNAVLDPSVNKRASFHFGDSLGFEAPGPHGPFWQGRDPMEFENRDKFRQWLDKYKDPLLFQQPDPFEPNAKNLLDRASKESWEPAPGSYVEAQIHEGVPWSDVQALVSKRPADTLGYSPTDRQRILDRYAASLITKADLGDRPAYGFYRKVPADPLADVTDQWLKVRPGFSPEEIPTSQLSEIGYAKGGPVDLPNLPSKGVPQSGPMHYGSDEDGYAEGGDVRGYAEGGKFLRFVRDLLKTATPTESVATDFVRQHAADTGKEALIYGRRDVPYSDVALGTDRSVRLPPNWIDEIRKGSDYPLFTAHSHPRETPTPSSGDLNVWANINDATKNVPQDQLARQYMWITGRKGPNDLSVIEPAVKEIGRRTQDVTMANDVHMRRLAPNSTSRKEMYDLLGQVTDAYFGKNTMPNSERHAAIVNLEQGILGNRLSQYVPLHYDPSAPVVAARDATIGDLWPEAVDYLNSKGFSPYAKGGKVDDLMLAYNSQYYANGGQVDHKVSKDSVDYSMGMGTHRCMNCIHFQKPHSCEEVQGNINPRFWCQKFLMAKDGT